MGAIYKLTSPSGKEYIGQTQQALDERIKQHTKQPHCVALYAAIQKYGIESFKVEILCECDDRHLDMLEKVFIAEYNTLCPYGYNIRTGGSNGLHCEESRERMRLAKLGEKNHNFGKPRTETAKENISKAKRGENHHFFGKTLTYEHRLSLSHARKSYDLPMYLVYIKPRTNAGGGYAVVNHPKLRTKYFTSKNTQMKKT